MVGSNKQSSPAEATYLRKIRKPLIEKKRRERINQSITQLRALIDDTVKENMAPMTRVDKADILELTVCHLTKLCHQRVAMPTTDSQSYEAGYQDCSRHVMSFLLSNGLIDSSKVAELNYHLQTSMNIGSVRHVQSFAHASTPNHRTRPSCITSSFAAIPTLRKISPIQPRTYENTYFKSRDISSPLIDCTQQLHAAKDHLPRIPSDSSRMLESTSFSSHGDSSLSDSLFSSSGESHNETGTVSIGTGSEDEIGHVIKETTWRPW